MKKVIVQILPVLFLFSAEAFAQNGREVIQNTAQIQTGKANIERDRNEILEMRQKLNAFNGTKTELVEAFQFDFSREIEQTEQKIRQSRREIRQSGAELRTERREIRDGRRQLKNPSPGNRRDAANLRNDRRDRRNDRRDKQDDRIDTKRLENLLEEQKQLLVELKSSASKSVVENFINTMSKDLKLSQSELIEDRGERIEDKRERREDRRERREKYY